MFACTFVDVATAQVREAQRPPRPRSSALVTATLPLSQWEERVFEPVQRRFNQLADFRPPSEFLVLYLTQATLQMLDVHSTRRALSLGAREANPLLRPLASNTATLTAAKLCVTGVAIYGSERLRKRNRAAALAVMIGLNSLSAIVVTNNYGVNTVR